MSDHRQLERVATHRRLAGDPLWWQTLAECRRLDAPPDLFITSGDRDDDPYYPPSEALVYCGVCPMRVECLNWGLDHKEAGVWGGTSAYQRRQLRRAQPRATCPACGHHDIEIVDEDHEICMSCAVSWPTLRPLPVDRREALG